MVSPWKTGLGNSTFSKPRLPTVVPSVVSPTDTPTAMPSVSRLLTSGLPNSALAAAWKSMCSGCGFIVIVEKKTLSASVMVRPTSCLNVCPTCSSSKYFPAMGGLPSTATRDVRGPPMVDHPARPRCHSRRGSAALTSVRAGADALEQDRPAEDEADGDQLRPGERLLQDHEAHEQDQDRRDAADHEGRRHAQTAGIGHEREEIDAGGGQADDDQKANPRHRESC